MKVCVMRLKETKMEMSFQKNLLEETRKCLKELKNCILISFCCLVFVGCNNKTNHASTINNTDFTAEELEMIRQNDSAFKAFIINAKQLRDSIKCAYIENDHDKAAASQYLLLRSGDNYYDLTCHYQAIIIFSHEFDSMAVWFPVEDAILKKHWLVEAEE